MFKQLSIVDLIKAVQKRVVDGTGKQCVDHVKMNQKSPFYYVTFLQSVNSDTKTMYCKNYTVQIDVIAEPSDSSVPIYKYITLLQEAMTEDIILPEGFNLVIQTDNGVQSIYTDETNEKHAVMLYTFKIAYGFKTK